MTEISKTDRISRIIEAVQKAIGGDFSSPIEPSGKKDEISRLADAVNRLVEVTSELSAGKQQAEARRRNNEEKYRHLEANIPGMVYLFAKYPDGTFSFSYVNEASRTLFDISPEDLMRDATLLTRLIHPDDRERFDSSIKKSTETLQPWREVLRHIVNGEVRWYDCISRPELQPNGGVLWDGIILEITDRMKALESLRKSEKRLSDIISASPVGIGIHDDSGQCIAVNDSLARMIGGTKQQVLKKNYNKLESWKKSGMLDMARTAVRTQSVRRHEIVTTSSFGKEVALDCHLVPFGAEGLLFMAQDITERKRTEDALRKALRNLRNSQKLAKVGSWDWDIQKGEVEWSDEVYRIFGLDPENFHPQINSIMERFHPEERKLQEELILQTIANREHYSFEARIILPDGSTRFLTSTSAGYFDDSDNLIKISGAVQDITERKRSEEKLQRSKAYAEKLIESANAMIVVLDAEGQIRVFNKAAEQITGYARQEVLGCNWFELMVPKDEYSNMWDAFLKSAQEGLPRLFENTILTKNSEERFISFQNTEILENGEFAGSISYGIDITERKQLEERLLHTQKMEGIGQLAGGVAHDFNNMLSVILGHAEFIKSDLPAGHPLLESILEIEKAGLHSRDTTSQLLAFSRKQIIAPITTDLNQLIKNVKTMISQLIGEDIDLRFFPGKDLWTVKFDPSQIDQILINLAVNARDAMPLGGLLTFETSNVYLDEVYCSSHVECSPGPFVLLVVTDNGDGMDKEMLSHIFEPFFTTKEVGKGTGLGLATVYGIVKQHGGFINAYSEPGKGTTFKIYIPRFIDEEKEEKVLEEAPLQFCSGTVLLVEDDDMVRRMATALLEKIGYTVVTVESPLEALTIFEKEDTSIDLLITDVVMPQMSGKELTDKIQKIKPGLKVLFMSGYTENVIVHHGVLKEGVHFIAKPFRINDFAQKVRETMEDR
jgi:two-component system, cell cycle sensor histidine kinase and response regulator CckA